ncbi:N-acetylmuramoyl-L-alanine amidase [Roseovarius sp. EL26]|uniref:N-acetylmuramoyl-L-alanine amidase n=1 Tax=Roseovarius sp. EL26 TaxID=2126672 RepID=UPI000EA3AE89|nr:N-acetylmuramoyl-L-alanine amidase [Roseovarius sp. EL26]
MIYHHSPNFGPRRNDLRPDLIVLHYTAMQSAKAALARLCDPQFEVSAHYLISETGTVWQMVKEEMRAWHAGAGEWHSQKDINSRSIGIELANTGTHPFPEPQMAALEVLMQGIMSRWDIRPEGVIGHSDMAPGRKCDPGPRFDWLRLEHIGLAAPRYTGDGPQQPSMDQFRTLALAAGYTSEADDRTLLEAVRLRYRPHAQGPLCTDDFRPLRKA